MNKYEFPLSPILLTLILGPMCEQNYVRFMNLNHGDFTQIFHSPIAMAFLALAVLSILYSVWNQNKINKAESARKAAERDAAKA